MTLGRFYIHAKLSDDLVKEALGWIGVTVLRWGGMTDWFDAFDPEIGKRGILGYAPEDEAFLFFPDEDGEGEEYSTDAKLAAVLVPS